MADSKPDTGDKPEDPPAGGAGGDTPPADPPADPPNRPTPKPGENPLDGAGDGDGGNKKPDGDGDGDKPARPDWLPEKFYDGEKGEAKTEELAKAYANAQALISKGEHKPPKDGKYALKPFEFLTDGEQVDDPLENATDDSTVKALLAAAQEHNLSQAAFDAISSIVAKELVAGLEAEKLSVAEIKQQLGKEPDKFLGTVKGIIDTIPTSTAEREALSAAIGRSPDAMKAVYRLFQAYNGGNVPVMDVDMRGGEGQPTMAELTAATAKVSQNPTDAAAQREYDDIIKRAEKAGGFKS